MATPKKAAPKRRLAAAREAAADGPSAAEVRNEMAAVAVPIPATPEGEVSERAARRRFTAEYKLSILRAADACAGAGEIGALLRKEGLYSSHLTTWRRQREAGSLAALAPKRRGRPATPSSPLARRVAELERENAQLLNRLKQAETIIEVQKNSPRCWGSP
jgi:transposase-like protein